MKHSTVLLLPVALLAACATPQERCQRDATAALRAHEGRIATAQDNVSRGYAVHSQSVPYTYQGTCYTNDLRYSCPRTGYRREETPVAIDVSQERAKLKRLHSQQVEIEKHAIAALNQCAYVSG